MSKIVETILSVPSITGGQSVTGTFQLGDAKEGEVMLTVRAIYGAGISGTQGVRMRLLGSADGTNYDTDSDEDALYVFSPTATASATRQKSYIVSDIAQWAKVILVNLAAVTATATCTVLLTKRK